jgi:DNA-binding response OmpR family regulator
MFIRVGWLGPMFAPPEGKSSMERASTQATALVIDDDVVLRSTLAELLQEEGFETIQASNGFSGLRLAGEHHPQIILLDLLLPELSGTEVLRELRSGPAGREMAIVVVTGSPDSLSAAQVAEADGVVRKPFDVSGLLLTMHRAVQRAASRAAEVAPLTAAAPVLPVHQRAKRLATSPRRARGRRI